MTTITTTQLYDLVTADGEPCVSIFMSTHPAGREGQQDAVRLKNLLVEAEQELMARGMRGVTARKFLEPIARLTVESAWEKRKNGLAIFRSQEKLVSYQLEQEFPERLVVGRHFYVKPLVPLLGTSSNFLVLAFSRNHVRLLKGTAQGYERLKLPGLPLNMEWGLNLQTADRGEQVHSGMWGVPGKEGSVFHGQGGHRDTDKEELAEYCRLVDDALRPVLSEMPWPLVLAGVEYEVAIFRLASTYPNIAREALRGSFDLTTDQELYEQGRVVVQQSLGTPREEALDLFRTTTARNRTSDAADEIVPAAYEGRVDTLFVDCEAEVPGRYDPATRSLSVDDDGLPMFDLVELAITETIRHRGTVYAATANELPAGSAMCALLRY
jgi:hypothetical protein